MPVLVTVNSTTLLTELQIVHAVFHIRVPKIIFHVALQTVLHRSLDLSVQFPSQQHDHDKIQRRLRTDEAPYRELAAGTSPSCVIVALPANHDAEQPMGHQVRAEYAGGRECETYFGRFRFDDRSHLQEHVERLSEHRRPQNGLQNAERDQYVK